MKTFYSFLKGQVCVMSLLCLSSLSQAQVNIYAAPNGAATGNGATAASPVSIDQARAIAKANLQSPCTIWLADGIYPALSLNASDSRSSGAPLTYQSVNVNGAVFQPEIALNPANFKPIPDSIKARIIDPTAKTKVMQLSLASLNLKDTSQWPLLFAIAYLKSPKFYRNGVPLSMSRYPSDTAMMTIQQVVQKVGSNVTPGGIFKYRDDRSKYWQSAINDGGVYLSGNWQFPWQMDVIKTLSISTADSLITQAIGIGGGIGTQVVSRIAPGTEPYYAINLVEEIAAEGQWSINFKTKTLYMWVPASGTLTCSGDAKMPAISLVGVNYTRFVGIAVRGGSGNGIELNSCSNVLIGGSHIYYCSGNGINIIGGSNCTVQSNDIDSVGAGGVYLASSNFSADQFNLTSSGHQVINNHIYSYARESFLYKAAVDVVSAVGAYVAYNKIHDAPHVGVLYGGNNNVMEYNEIYDVVKKYTDMGAFYTWGHSGGWMSRGNKLNQNYIHDAPQANGIYQDEWSSGDSSSYNIIANVVMGTYNNFGYFNAYTNNIYSNNTYPVTCKTTPVSDAGYKALYDSLQKIWNNSAAFKKAYPECADMVGAAGRNNAYTSRIWPSETGNVFISNPGVVSAIKDNNLFYADGTTNAAYAQTDPFVNNSLVFKTGVKITKNLMPASGAFSMDSLRSKGVFGRTGGQNWHINRMGLHKDSYRKDISTTKVAGIDPILSLKVASSNNFESSGTITITAGVRIPNAVNLYSYILFMDNGKSISGLNITQRVITFDSVVFTIQWPAPVVGSHQLNMHVYDAPYWEYVSNTVNFTITDTTTTAAAVATMKDTTAASSVGLSTSASPSDSSATGSVSNKSIDEKAGRLSLYPNPAIDFININYRSSRDEGDAEVVLIDMVGRVLLTKQVAIREGMNQIALPLTNMAGSVYFVELKLRDSKVAPQRFVIQR